MIGQISANDLKVKGISAIDDMISKENTSIVITVRGKEKYVVLPIEEYNTLREYELEMAIQESKKDIKNGKIYKDGIENHMKRISSDV